jgi:4-amino-4-deoxy-L-arabinose transferase-like glycosyltransferase
MMPHPMTADRRAPTRLPEPLRAHPTAWAVVALVVVALGLRWACLRESLFGDELFLWAIVHGRSPGEVFDVVRDTEKTPLLGFALGWVFARGPDADVLVRLPSLVAGVATIPLVHALGRRTVGGAAGLVAAAWLAVSPFAIFYATDARGYALVTAFVVLSTLALLTALDDGRRRWWALYAVAVWAAASTHYIAALVLVPQAAWALWTHREQAREELIAGGVAVVAWLPWLPSFLIQARNSADEARRISEMVPFTLGNVAKTLVQPLAGHPYVGPAEVPGVVPLVVLALALAAAALAAVLGRPRPAARAPVRSRARLLALLALTPPLVIVLYSSRPEASFLLPRNLWVAVPYAVLLAGRLLTLPPRPAAIACPLAAVLAIAWGGAWMLGDGHGRPDSRATARFIDARAAPGTPVVDVPGPHATRVYLRKPHDVYVSTEYPRAWAAAARAGTPLVVSFPHVGGIPRLLVPPARYAGRYRLVAEHRAPGVPYTLTTRVYAPRAGGAP